MKHGTAANTTTDKVQKATVLQLLPKNLSMLETKGQKQQFFVS